VIKSPLLSLSLSGALEELDPQFFTTAKLNDYTDTPLSWIMMKTVSDNAFCGSHDDLS
jgi:hypothetical protein